MLDLSPMLDALPRPITSQIHHLPRALFHIHAKARSALNRHLGGTIVGDDKAARDGVEMGKDGIVQIDRKLGGLVDKDDSEGLNLCISGKCRRKPLECGLAGRDGV